MIDMSNRIFKVLSALFLSAAIAVLIVACGGGSSVQEDEPEQPYTGNIVNKEEYEERAAPSDGTDMAALYAETYTSVVTVSVSYAGSSGGIVSVQQNAVGTGTIIDLENGFILTSASLFEDGGSTVHTDAAVLVSFYDGNSADAALLAYDTVASSAPTRFTAPANSDLAILRVNAENIPSGATEAGFADSGALVYGADCFTVAAAATGDATIPSVMDVSIITKPYNTHTGNFTVLSGFSRSNFFDGSFEYLISTGITMRSGSAGAALFNAEGDIIGMLNDRVENTYVFQTSDIYGVSFATPFASVKAFLNKVYAEQGLEEPSFSVDSLIRQSIFTADSIIKKATAHSTLDPVNTLPADFEDYCIVSEDSKIVIDGDANTVSGTTTAERVAAERVNSTVSILHYAPAYEGYRLSEGSGFLINGDGYLVTNMHVINDLADSSNGTGNINENVQEDLDTAYLYAIFENGTISDNGDIKYALLPLEVVAYDKRGDLAVLRFVNAISHEEDGGSAVGFSEDAVCSLQTNASFGESVVAIGNPQGYGITLSEGIVSNPVFDYYESEVGYAHVLTDCPVNGGNSGGPLFNAGGDVIAVNTLGINSEAYPAYENISWSIPASAVITFLQTVNQLYAEDGATDTEGAFRGNGQVYYLESRVPTDGIVYSAA